MVDNESITRVMAARLAAIAEVLPLVPADRQLEVAVVVDALERVVNSVRRA